MITSFNHSIDKLICFALIILLFPGFATLHAGAAENESRQPEIESTSEISHQQSLLKAEKDWNTLKYSDDVEALTEFKKQYSDTAYGQKAERRIKYLKILRQRSEILEKEQQAIIKRQSENSQSASNPFLIAKHRTWRAYRLLQPNQQTTCYVAATPVSMAPANRNHGDIFFMLTKYTANRNFEPHLTIGDNFRASSSVRVNIGGKIFNMFTRENDAWVENVSHEPAFLSAMKSAANMELTGFTIDGTSVKYLFSLDGMPAAMDALRQCS